MSAALEQSVALEALALIDVGILAVDRSCRVLHANAFAEDLLRLTPELRLVQRQLLFSTSTLQDRFSTMVRDSLLSAGTRNAPVALALSIACMNRLPMTLSIAPLRQSKDGIAPTLAMVLLRDSEWPPVDRRCLRELFGLTHAEALVAADLVRGWIPDEIAHHRRIGLATVRSHLKSILSKTGTRRMAQAVAVISRSVATLAHRTEKP